MTFFFLFVLSSLTEGSLSLAGGLCEQDTAEQTGLILPNIEGSLINPGNPRRAARGLLETRCSLPLGTAAGPASPATERSQPPPVGPLPGLRRVVPSQAARAALPTGAVRAALQNTGGTWGSEGSSCLGDGCIPSAQRPAKRCGPRLRGAAQRVAFWMSSSAKKHYWALGSCLFKFYFILTLLA